MSRAALLNLLFTTLASALPTYTVTVLPIPSGYSNITMFGINNAGQVTGNGVYGALPFISSPTGTVLIPLGPGMADIGAGGLNNSGQVVGGAVYQRIH